MTLNKKIEYWVENAEYDLRTAEIMQKSARYIYTAFMCQQAIEKLIKAYYLKENKNEAPRSHNLSYLIGLINVKVDKEYIELLAQLSTFYIEGRYPTYKQKIADLLNKEKSLNILNMSKELFVWLKEMLM